ncbi:hypothetical protein J2X69_002162 [Algoriphagus sp. 4150]|uniref:hypothetical protein n=1 Tax=Algoriphagus sp. 4150 TaxID=2817756 RepID=UPI00285FA85C|nr:hypothetical protein [Algoriphagus sp. 4150]MDR7129816.1 hypothetical protein [Algoriphagus sp. 4150]
MTPYLREHRGDDYIQSYTASADLLVVMARWGDAARGCGWYEGGRLLASWPFGSFGPSQKNKEIKPTCGRQA